MLKEEKLSMKKGENEIREGGIHRLVLQSTSIWKNLRRFWTMKVYCKTCPDCKGTGYDFGDGGQCERCGGTGEISDDD